MADCVTSLLSLAETNYDLLSQCATRIDEIIKSMQATRDSLEKNKLEAYKWMLAFQKADNLGQKPDQPDELREKMEALQSVYVKLFERLDSPMKKRASS